MIIMLFQQVLGCAGFFKDSISTYAVSEKMQRYRSGHNEADSKSYLLFRKLNSDTRGGVSKRS